MKDLHVNTNAGVRMVHGSTDGAVYINASGTLLLQLGPTVIAAYTSGREVQTLQNVQYVRGGVTAIAAWKRWVCEQIYASRLSSTDVDEEELRAIVAVSISNAYLGVGALTDMAQNAARNLEGGDCALALNLATFWGGKLYTFASTIAANMRDTHRLSTKVADRRAARQALTASK